MFELSELFKVSKAEAVALCLFAVIACAWLGFLDQRDSVGIEQYKPQTVVLYR